MATNDQEVRQETEISQESAKSSSTVRIKEKTRKRPVSPAKPAARPVKAKFKAGKDL